MLDESTKKKLVFIINTVFIALTVLIIYVIFKYLLSWLLPFVIAFCIVALLRPLVRVMENAFDIKRKNVALAVTAFLYVLVACVLLIAALQIAYAVSRWIADIVPYYETTIQPSLTKAGEGLSAFVSALPVQVSEQLSGIQTELFTSFRTWLISLSQDGVTFITVVTRRIPSFLLAFIFTIMLSFFLSSQYEDVTRFISRQLPPKPKRIFAELRKILSQTAGRYLKAALTLMVITFTELCIGLLFLKAGNVVPLAAGIAILDALPFFGVGAALIPWGIIELLQGNTPMGAGLLILYCIILVVRNILEPKIVGDRLGLNPIVTLTSIYVGFKLIGVLGMILFPILTQIAVQLHKKGIIKLFKEE
jgi:sporulation integral membrane protein YtvI